MLKKKIKIKQTIDYKNKTTASFQGWVCDHLLLRSAEETRRGVLRPPTQPLSVTTLSQCHPGGPLLLASWLPPHPGSHPHLSSPYTHKGPASSNPIVFLNLLLLQLSATSWVLNRGRPCPPQQTRSRLWLQACICNLPSRVSRQAMGCSQNAIKPQAHTRPLQYQTQCFTSSRYPSAASRSKRPSKRAP